MISAFAQSAKALNRKIYLDAAKKAADFCLSELRLKNGRLHKKDGEKEKLDSQHTLKITLFSHKDYLICMKHPLKLNI